MNKENCIAQKMLIIIPRLNKKNMKNYLYNISHLKFEHVLFKKIVFYISI